MRKLRQSARPPGPAPAPSPADVFIAGGVISSPPAPYAVGSPAPCPAPSPAATAPAGRRGGASLSPPLIAMLAVVGAALLVVLYARLVSRVFRAARRRWRRRRRLRLLMIPPGSPSSVAGDSSFASFTTYDNYYHTFSPYRYGLDDAAIKSLPSAQFVAPSPSVWAAKAAAAAARECAVCLLEFADGDELRALPLCAHAFHADCIDVWLRAHASCPLCRAAVALPPPVASPVRAARRGSLDDLLFFHPVPQPVAPLADAVPEIGVAADCSSPDQQLDPRGFLLKRSYSFGFERSLGGVEGTTASPPWRFRASAASASRGGRSSFWSKRWPSPFGGGGGGGSAAARVFSFRSYRSAAAKSSPFSRRRGAASATAGGGGGGPGSGFFFMSLASEPPSILAAARRSRAASSRLRCGDPEALLSPDRLGSR